MISDSLKKDLFSNILSKLRIRAWLRFSGFSRKKHQANSKSDYSVVQKIDASI